MAFERNKYHELVDDAAGAWLDWAGTENGIPVYELHWNGAIYTIHADTIDTEKDAIEQARRIIENAGRL